MATGKSPAIFVSSTCYDLAQIRADIKDFIELIGYEPVLSEYSSFPVDPNSQTMDNCLKVVEKHADIFVLIIGGRYGSKDEEGRSITNLEYLKAKAMGIPVYIFIQKNILNILPVWKGNPDSDFKTVVDSPKLFEFVDKIRSSDNQWVHPFETAQEITFTLKRQLSYLFSNSLEYRKKIYQSKTKSIMNELSGEELRIVIEKPVAWEYRLFSTILENGLKECYGLRQDLKYGIVFGEGRQFEDLNALITWIPSQTNLLLRNMESLSKIVEYLLPEAFGEPGQSGDPEKIVYGTKKFVEGYKNALLWALECKRLDSSEELEPLIASLSSFCDNMISEIEEYNEKVKRELESGLKQYFLGGSVELDFTLTITASGVDEFSCELNKLKKRYGF